MPEKDDVSRRLFLGSAVAASALLAGCSGGGGTETASPTETPSDTETETATATEEPTPEPTTVETFPYPDGATRDGIDPAQLFSAHRTTIIDGGSATVAIEMNADRGDFTTSAEMENSYGAAGILSVESSDGLTERLWSPADEDVGYVEMDTGFEQRYRIDNRAPGPQEVLYLSQIDRLLAGGQWSEAMEVVEHPSGEGVVYETTGIESEQELLRAFPGEAVSSFTASVTLTESGYLHDLTYEITVDRGDQSLQQQATITTEMVGTTDLSEPSWTSSARENGVQFEVGVTDGSEALELNLVNGSIPSGSRVNLSSTQFGSATLGQSLSADDTLYASFTSDNEVVLGVNEPPSGATELTGFVFIGVRDGQFTLLEQDVSL